MLADAPWTIWYEISLSPQDILPAGIMFCWQTPSAGTLPPAVSTLNLFTRSDSELVYHIGSFDHEIVYHWVLVYKVYPLTTKKASSQP